MYRSLIIGFALSILGSILLFLGQLGSFAGGNVSRMTTRLPILFFPVLYTIGVLVSLAGTGFLIGVCYSTFPVLSVAQLSFDAVRHSD